MNIKKVLKVLNNTKLNGITKLITWSDLILNYIGNMVIAIKSDQIREQLKTNLKPHKLNVESDVQALSRGPNIPARGIKACWRDH